jgi:hypothetical protein
MPVTTEPISLLQQTLTEFAVLAVGVTLVVSGALLYFRRVRMERPPVGTFNGRDIVILLAFISVLPFLYGYLPYWLITCLLIVTFASALYIGYHAILGPGWTWLGIGLLIGLNYWTSHHLMGSTAFGAFDEAHGFAVNLVVTALASCGAAFLSGRPRLIRPALVVFAVLCLADWVLIQDLGFLGGLGTDPNSMIPFVLLAVGGYLALTRSAGRVDRRWIATGEPVASSR